MLYTLISTYLCNYISMYLYLDIYIYIYVCMYTYSRGGCGRCVFAAHYVQWFRMSRVVVRGFLCRLFVRLVQVFGSINDIYTYTIYR